MNGKVLITGASGFLGYHLVMAALENKLEVFAAVRPSSDVEHLKPLPINFIHLDYGDAGLIQKELEAKGIEYIIHAAGVTKASSDEEYEKINAGYTKNLGEAAAQTNGLVKKIVLISSLAAPGPLKFDEGLLKEDTHPNPVTAYGRSKLKAENSLINTGVPAVILRPTAIYGPREKDIFLVFRALNSGLDAYIGSKPQTLSFVHGRDVADAAMLAIGKTQSSGIYNIADGFNYGRYEFADIVKRELNKKPFRVHLPVGLVRPSLFLVEKISSMRGKVPTVNREKLNELLAENWGCDISRAKTELGFTPKFNLQTGIAETVNWYKEYKWI